MNLTETPSEEELKAARKLPSSTLLRRMGQEAELFSLAMADGDKADALTHRRKEQLYCFVLKERDYI